MPTYEILIYGKQKENSMGALFKCQMSGLSVGTVVVMNCYINGKLNYVFLTIFLLKCSLSDSGNNAI